MPTKERIKRVESVLSFRQPDLRVVLEEVTNTHNASAVARTCDAAGILHVDIISAGKESLPVNEAISTRAEQWLNFRYYESTRECLEQIRKEGLKIAATKLGDKAVPHTGIDYTQPIAVVFGNESEGISEKAAELADYIVKIPMFGMAQSLNLSVSVGIILYEAIRQRHLKGYCNKHRLSTAEFQKLRDKWLK
ncbi:MAG: RNA methyltransferase [Candidatus Aminicenantes bacterium]|jgi:tRNA (guanosine-2'-O-)-methyltransferase